MFSPVPERDGFWFDIAIFVIYAAGFTELIEPSTLRDPVTLIFPEGSMVTDENPIVPCPSATTGTELIAG